jgi:hypothetical protein
LVCDRVNELLNARRSLQRAQHPQALRRQTETLASVSPISVFRRSPTLQCQIRNFPWEVATIIPKRIPQPPLMKTALAS